jgi:hypothetical protein
VGAVDSLRERAARRFEIPLPSWREYTTEIPNAAKGEYVIMQFQTSFESKENAVETVTPMLDDEGVWRVSGYYIR